MENDPSPSPGSIVPPIVAIQHPLEKFLQDTGWGLYSRFIVGIICFVNFAQGVTFAAVPWALALSTCDQLFIPRNVALKIFTSLFVGKLLGQIFIGLFIDRYGRKKYLTYSLIFVFMSTFIAAFAYNALILVGAILFLGIGLETNNAIVRLLLAEILPQERRGFYLSMCCLFWTVGYFVTCGFTILFETKTFLNNDRTDPRLAPWRVMFVSCGGINIFIACSCALLEESPRHYLYLGKTYLGYLILKQLYAINTSMHADSFKVKEADIKACIKSYQFAYREPESTFVAICKLVWRTKEALKMIFSKRFMNLTMVLSLIQIPVTVSSAFHLNVLFAKQTAMDHHKMPKKLRGKENIFDLTSDKVRSLDLVYPVLHAYDIRESNISENLSTCGDSEKNKFFHEQFLIFASCLVFGSLICMIFVDRVGRKWLMFSGLLLASMTTSTFAFINYSYLSYTVLAAFLILANSLLWAVVTVVTVESYPTAVRGTAIAVTSFFGLLAQIMYVNFMNMDLKVFCLCLGVLYFCLSFFCFLIEELKNKPMVE